MGASLIVMCRNCADWRQKSNACASFERDKRGKSWAIIDQMVNARGGVVRRKRNRTRTAEDIEPFHGFTRRFCQFYQQKQ